MNRSKKKNVEHFQYNDSFELKKYFKEYTFEGVEIGREFL